VQKKYREKNRLGKKTARKTSEIFAERGRTDIAK
jgi:hypothetical protein